jgi:WD40 repeat protein
VLQGHQDEIFIIEAHPTNPQLLLTAGHDGYIILWNLTVGKVVKKFYNSVSKKFLINTNRSFFKILKQLQMTRWVSERKIGIQTKYCIFNMFKHFQLEGQGHGAVFDCKFSPDGEKFATTDSHGHLAIYGFGSNEPYQKVCLHFHSLYNGYQGLNC